MDELTLTLPRDRAFYGIAHLVLAGFASRLECTVEHLDDLQLALDSLLDHRDGEGDVTITLRLDGDTIEAELEPVPDRLRADLERAGGPEMDLGRVLRTVVDDVELRAGSVKLTKTIRRVAAGG